jgi:hypothetical protein
MPWPFGSSNKVAPAPIRTLSKDNPLCLMFSAWQCKSRRLNGDGKRSCYCAKHTCEAPGCINVVAGPKQRYCQKHQLNALQPQPRAAAAPGAAAPAGAPGAHDKQVMRKRAQAKIILQHQAKVDAETEAVTKAIGELAQGVSFRSMMKAETSNSGQLMYALSDNKLFNDLQWSGMAEFLNAEMLKYISREKNFAAEFCQDLLLFCSAKIEQSDVEFVVFVGKLVAFPLLAPYIAVATGAAAAGGAIAAHAADTGFSVAKSAAEKGAGFAAKKALGLNDPTQLKGRPPEMAKESQGWVNGVLEFFVKARANPITFARVLSRRLESSPSGEAEKVVINHFGRDILRWDDYLAPGSFI